MSRRNKLLATYFASMVGLALLNVFLSLIPNRLSDNGLDIVYSLLAQVVCMGIIPLVGGLLTYRKGRTGLECVRHTLNRWNYRLPYDKRVWAPVALLCISFIFVTQLVARIGNLALVLGQFTFPIQVGPIYNNVGELLLWIAVGAILPATFEELTHRGLVLDALGDGGNEIVQVFVGGLLFALMHTNIMQFLYAFVGGCVMAFVVVKTGSILPAMLMHFVNNTYSHLSNYASQNPRSILGWIDVVNDFFTSNVFMLIVGAILLIVNVIVALWLLSWLQRSSGKPEGLKEITLLGVRRKGVDQEGRPTVSTQRLISLDTYRPYGKARLKDNVFLAGVITTTTLSTIFTYVWGVMR